MLNTNKTKYSLAIMTKTIALITLILLISNMAFANDDYSLDKYLFVNSGADNYNEQGYSKNSNNISAQSNINNYSGALMYSHRLFEVPGKNGMDLTIDLNYNGQVSHLSPNSFNLQTNDIPCNANINLPEWIISVNGVAAQVFNFEVDAHNITDGTYPPIGKATGDNVCKMVDGWHVSQTCNGGYVVQINILSGCLTSAKSGQFGVRN